LRRFLPDTLNWVYADPTLTITLTFPETMSEVTTPVPGDFVIIVDDVEKTPLDVEWGMVNDLAITYDEAILGPTAVRLRFPTKTDLFISDLDELITPFDLLVSAP